MSLGTFKEWPFRCLECQHPFKELMWSSQLDTADPRCPECAGLAQFDQGTPKGKAPGVFGDELPVGYEAKHGVCHEDGTPRRFDTKTDLKRALNEAGLTILGDTPKPYAVPWSGRRKAND